MFNIVLLILKWAVWPFARAWLTTREWWPKYKSNILKALKQMLKAHTWPLTGESMSRPVAFLARIDLLMNALLGGDPDESISSRAGKIVDELDEINCTLCSTMIGSAVALLLCKLLNLFDKDHCEKSIRQEEGDDAIIK